MKDTASKHMRMLILALTALLGMGLGAVFALPLYHRDFARVEFTSVTVAAEVAGDPESRRIGLSGRPALAGKTGMLFLFDRADYWNIWMRKMKFPIDILWLKNNAVADMEEYVPAPASGKMSDFSLPAYRPDIPADMVLEVPAGFVDAHGVRIGDPVAVVFQGAAPGEMAGTGVAAVNTAPGREYFIESLRASPARGTGFAITGVKEENGAYKKFSIAYSADGRPLTGVMNVPVGPVPAGGFPVLILNHGLIRPDIYFSGRGSRREQDFFARKGYVTIHPDYRGYSGLDSVASEASVDTANTAAIAWPWYGRDSAFPEHHDFYAGYTEDVVALIDALQRSRPQFIDLNRMGLWGHSMGGGIAARAMVLNRDIRAYVLFAPVSADAEDNFYELTPDEVAWLRKTYGTAGSPAYQKISPLGYFSDVSAPVQLHHGIADAEVPIAFSQKMFAALRQYGKKAELFTYPGEKHEFADAWPLAAGRALQFFDKYVKNAR